jgi:hypothetical protein
MIETKLEEVVDNGVKVVYRDTKREKLRCDTVALAVGLKPCRDLYETLRRETSELHLIGDCKEPRKILHAIWDGYFIAYR